MRLCKFQQKVLSGVLCLMLAITQVFTQPVLAKASVDSLPNVSALSALDPFKLKIPESLGKVEEAFSDREADAVLLIQDAHAIVDAQKNIQKLIAYFQEEYGIRQIAVEGASGSLEPQIFKSFPSEKKLKGVFKDYLQRGELTGAAAAALFNSFSASYEGVENWELYQEGYRAYLSAAARRPEINERLKSWQDNLQGRKQKIYPPNLLEVDQALSRFLQEHSDLTLTLQTLAKILPPEPGSEIALILAESRRRGDSAELTAEVRWLAVKIRREIQEIPLSEKPDRTGVMSEKLKEFERKFQDFQTDQISAKTYALYLQRLIDDIPGLRQQIVRRDPGITGKLQTFSGTARRLEAIEGTRFFRDVLQYAGKVKDSLLTGDDLRALDRESEKLALLNRLNELKLDQEDWEEMTRQLAAGISWVSPRGGDLRPLFKEHLAFYENAKKRDAVMFEKIVGMLDDHKRRRDRPADAVKTPGDNGSLPAQHESLILVAGGFHTHGLTQLLKEKGISYAVIMPAIAHVPEKTRYEDQMLGHVSWSHYLKVEKGGIDLNAAFIRGSRDRLLGKNGSMQETGWDLETASHDPRLLKNWRDQIIRDLSEQGRIQEAGDYTRYIDEIVRPENQDPLRRQWISNIQKFMGGMRDLERQGRLNSEAVVKLLQGPSVLNSPVTANGLARAQLKGFHMDQGRIVPALTAKSEVRAVTEESSSSMAAGQSKTHREILQFGDSSPAIKLNGDTEVTVSVAPGPGNTTGTELFAMKLWDEKRSILQITPLLPLQNNRKQAVNEGPILLSPGQTYKIGRHSANDFVTAANLGFISRFQGVLTAHEGGWVVYRDAGSLHGSLLEAQRYADLLDNTAKPRPSGEVRPEFQSDVSQLSLDVSMISEESMRNAGESVIFKYSGEEQADWQEAVLELHILRSRFLSLKESRKKGVIKNDALGQVDYLFEYGNILIEHKLFGNPNQPYYYLNHGDKPNTAAIRLSKSALLVVEELENRISSRAPAVDRPAVSDLPKKSDGLTDLEALLVSKKKFSQSELFEEVRGYIADHLKDDKKGLWRTLAFENLKRPDLYEYMQRARERNVILVFPREIPPGPGTVEYLERFTAAIEEIPPALLWQLQRPIYFAVLQTEGHVLGAQDLEHSLALGGADLSKFQHDITGFSLEDTIIHELIGHQMAVNGKRRLFNIQGNRISEVSNLETAWEPLISREGWQAIGRDNGLKTLIPLTPELRRAIEQNLTIGGMEQVKVEDLPEDKTALRHLLRNLLNWPLLYYQNILEITAFTSEGHDLAVPDEDGDVRNEQHNYERTRDILLVTNSRIDIPVDAANQVYVSHPYNRRVKSFDTVYVQKTVSGNDSVWFVVERDGAGVWQRTGKSIRLAGAARSEVRHLETQPSEKLAARLARDKKPEGVSPDIWQSLIQPPLFKEADGRMANPLIRPLKSGRGETLKAHEKAYLVGRFIESVKKHAMLARGEAKNRKYEWLSQTSSAAYMRHPSEDSREDLMKAASRRGYFSKNSLAFLEFWVEATQTGSVPLTQAEITEKALTLKKQGALTVGVDSAKKLLETVFDEFESQKFKGVQVRVIEDQTVTGVQSLKPERWKSLALRALTIVNLYLVYRFRSSLLSGVIGAFVMQFWGWMGLGGVMLISAKFIFDILTGNWLRTKIIQLITLARLDFFAQKEKGRILIRNQIYNYMTEELETRYQSVRLGEKPEWISAQEAEKRAKDSSYKVSERDFADEKKEYQARIRALRRDFEAMARDPSLTEFERGQIKDASIQIRLLGDMALKAFQSRYWYPNAGKKGIRKILKTAEIAQSILDGERGKSSPAAILWALTAFFMADIGNSPQAPPNFFESYQRPLWLFGASNQRVFQQVLVLARNVAEKVQYKKILEEYVSHEYHQDLARAIEAQRIRDETGEADQVSLEYQLRAVPAEKIESLIAGFSEDEKSIPLEQLEARIAGLELAQLAEINSRHYERFQTFFIEEASQTVNKMITPSIAAWNELAARMERQIRNLERDRGWFKKILRQVYDRVRTLALWRVAQANQRLGKDPFALDKTNAVLRGLLIGSVYINQDRLDDLYQKAEERSTRANSAYILTTLHRSVLWKRFLADLATHHQPLLDGYGLKRSDVLRLLHNMEDKTDKVIRQHLYWALNIDREGMKIMEASMGVDAASASAAVKKDAVEHVIRLVRKELKTVKNPAVMITVGELLLDKTALRRIFKRYEKTRRSSGQKDADKLILHHLRDRIQPRDPKQALVARSEVRQENFNELLRHYILGPLLENDKVEEITISYRENIPNEKNVRGNYLVVRQLDQDEKAIQTDLVSFDQVAAFYSLRYLFSFDPAISPPLDPATIGEAGAGHLFMEYRKGEDEIVQKGVIAQEVNEAEIDEILAQMIQSMTAQQEFYEIRAYAQADPDNPQTREVFHVTKRQITKEEGGRAEFNRLRERYVLRANIERHYELQDLLGKLAEQGLLISKAERSQLPVSEKMLAATKAVIREKKDDWKDRLEVLSETGWAQFMTDHLRAALDYLGSGYPYIHALPAEAGKDSLEIDQRIALLTQNMKEFLRFAIGRPEIDNDSLIQVLVTSLKMPMTPDTPAVDFYEELIDFVFNELGTSPGEADIFKAWHHSLETKKLYPYFKTRMAQVRAGRSEVRRQAGVEETGRSLAGIDGGLRKQAAVTVVKILEPGTDALKPARLTDSQGEVLVQWQTQDSAGLERSLLAQIDVVATETLSNFQRALASARKDIPLGYVVALQMPEGLDQDLMAAFMRGYLRGLAGSVKEILTNGVKGVWLEKIRQENMKPRSVRLETNPSFLETQGLVQSAVPLAALEAKAAQKAHQGFSSVLVDLLQALRDDPSLIESIRAGGKAEALGELVATIQLLMAEILRKDQSVSSNGDPVQKASKLKERLLVALALSQDSVGQLFNQEANPNLLQINIRGVIGTLISQIAARAEVRKSA